MMFPFMVLDPRWKQLVNELDSVTRGLDEYQVRNCGELVSCLHLGSHYRMRIPLSHRYVSQL